MKLHLLVATFGIGAVIGLHLAMNCKVGEIINSPRVANGIFWSIGGITGAIIGIIALMGKESGALNELRNVHPILWTAGAMGACLVLYIAWAIPQIGPGPFFSIMLSGQLIFGIVASHFGLLGPVQPISLFKVLGAGLMIAGICFIQLK